LGELEKEFAVGGTLEKLENFLPRLNHAAYYTWEAIVRRVAKRPFAVSTKIWQTHLERYNLWFR
jgi:hypothetical protein